MIRSTWYALAGFAAIALLGPARGVAAQSPTAEAWKLVPPLPTTCYPDDGFSERLSKASAAMNAERERQNRVNAAAREKFDNMDMAEKAQRMQAFMMKNPQAAMKMMQTEQAAGAASQTSVVQANEAAQRLQAELQRLQAGFRAAAEQAIKPVQARQKALIAAKTIEVEDAGVPMFTSAADHAQYVQLVAEENAAYEKACAPYFGANGSFHKWVSSYRAQVIDPVSVSDGGDAVMIMQMEAMGLPGGGYRSTVPLQQVSAFMDRLRTIWAVRQNQSQPVVQLRK